MDDDGNEGVTGKYVIKLCDLYSKIYFNVNSLIYNFECVNVGRQ